MSSPRQILKNAGALTLARGFTAVITFVTTVYLARILEPSGYGILNWGLAFLAYFNFAADLGLGVYAMREVARNRSEATTLPGHILILRLAGAFLTLGVYLAIVVLLDAEPIFKITVGVLGLSIVAHAIELGWVYHGLERLGVVAVRNVIASIVSLLGVIALVRHPEHLVIAAAVMVAAIAVPNVWLLFTYRREFGRPRFEANFKLWWAMLLPSFPIAVSHLLATINTNLDQVMLGLMRTETEVGWYAAAYRVITAATIPWQIALQAFLPALSAAVGSAMQMRERAKGFATTMYALGLPIAVGGFLIAADIVSVFGEAYEEAGPPLAILMLSLAFMYPRVLYGGGLVAWDRQRSYTAALAVGSAINIALNIALIPRYGMLGAAYATLITEAVVMVFSAIAFRRLVPDIFLGGFLRAAGVTIVGVAAPILVLNYLGLPVMIQIAASCVGYAGSLFVFGIVRTDQVIRVIRKRETD